MSITTLKTGEFWGKKLREEESDLFRLSLTHYHAGQTIKSHDHENDYISMLVVGNYIESNGNDQDWVAGGDILFRPRSYSHGNYFQKTDGHCFNIELKPDWIRMLDMNLKLPLRYQHDNAGRFPSILKLLINFNSVYNQDLALELLCDWLVSVNNHSLHSSFQPWIAKVCHILDNEVDIFHSLHSLADKVHVHPVYLARMFRERKGITIGEYQLKAKIAKAVGELYNTRLSISEISFRCGFYDQAHFTRSFKSLYQMTPLKFRTLLKS